MKHARKPRGFPKLPNKKVSKAITRHLRNYYSGADPDGVLRAAVRFCECYDIAVPRIKVFRRSFPGKGGNWGMYYPNSMCVCILSIDKYPSYQRFAKTVIHELFHHYIGSMEELWAERAEVEIYQRGV